MRIGLTGSHNEEEETQKATKDRRYKQGPETSERPSQHYQQSHDPTVDFFFFFNKKILIFVGCLF